MSRSQSCSSCAVRQCVTGGLTTFAAHTTFGQRAQRAFSAWAVGACQHALGNHAQAVEDYTRALGCEAENLSEEAKVRSKHSECVSAPLRLRLRAQANRFALPQTQQVLAFYQRDLAMYLHAKLDCHVDQYCLDKDNDLPPWFKVNAPFCGVGCGVKAIDTGLERRGHTTVAVLFRSVGMPWCGGQQQLSLVGMLWPLLQESTEAVVHRTPFVEVLSRKMCKCLGLRKP
jgi:hypothetical protein